MSFRETSTGVHAADDEAQPSAETVRLLAWRTDALERLGLDALTASAAALDTHFDTHEFARLIAKGCTPTTAYHILR